MNGTKHLAASMAEKAQFDIPIVLPGVADAADACVERIVARLRPRLGVTEVHVVHATGDQPAKLCIHYDPDALSLSTVRGEVSAAGAQIASEFGHVTWQMAGLHVRRARTVTESMARLPGVLEVNVNPAGLVRIEFERATITEDALANALTQLGAAPSDRAEKPAHGHEGRSHSEKSRGGEAEHDHDHGGPFGANSELLFALACGALLGAGFAIDKLWAAAPPWVALAFYVAANGFGGFFTVREAFDNLRLRRFEIDTLMLVAAAGAAALGAWAEGALLLFLFSLGHALEHFAMGRAKRAIEALAELAPRTALVRRADGSTEEIGVEQLAIGDVAIVKPDERIAADGFVCKGASAVNQAPITGESMPVDKRAVSDAARARGDPDGLEAAFRVFAGTINGSGALEIEVTRLASDSTLAKVVRLVSDAETQKSPTQRFTDRFERLFVPAVLGLVALLLFAWVVVDEPFRDSFYRAMAVLVAASPCALAIATPSAVLSGIARAARGGVLVKGGAPLELLEPLDAITFDKTGTLASGEPRIREIVLAAGVTKGDLMATAVAVESLSDHPLAQAIARDGKAHIGDHAVPAASELTSLTGRGVSAMVGGENVLIGKAEMSGADGVAPLSKAMAVAIEQLCQSGHTTMVARRGE